MFTVSGYWKGFPINDRLLQRISYCLTCQVIGKDFLLTIGYCRGFVIVQHLRLLRISYCSTCQVIKDNFLSVNDRLLQKIAYCSTSQVIRKDFLFTVGYCRGFLIVSCLRLLTSDA